MKITPYNNPFFALYVKYLDILLVSNLVKTMHFSAFRFSF